MGYKKLLLLLAVAALLLSIFFPWVVIASRGLTISGMQADGTTYGKPGLLSFLFAVLILIFSAVPRVWAHRICIFSSALNAGWALRNFLLLSGCQGGECPQRQPFFYLYLFSSLLVLVAVLVQDGKLPVEDPA